MQGYIYIYRFCNQLFFSLPFDSLFHSTDRKLFFLSPLTFIRCAVTMFCHMHYYLHAKIHSSYIYCAQKRVSYCIDSTRKISEGKKKEKDCVLIDVHVLELFFHSCSRPMLCYFHNLADLIC